MKNKITPKEFYKTHRYCPICGNNKLCVTLMGAIQDESKDFVDDINTVSCKCGFTGRYLDLMSEDLNTVLTVDEFIEKYFSKKKWYSQYRYLKKNCGIRVDKNNNFSSWLGMNDGDGYYQGNTFKEVKECVNKYWR